MSPKTRTPSELSLILRELRTPAPYLFTVVAAVMVLANRPPAEFLIAGIIFGFLLSLQSLVDLRTRLLPHSLNALIALSGLAFSLYHGPMVLALSLATSMVLFICFLGLAYLASKLAGKQALGGGDLYLVAAMGPWFGPLGIPPFFTVVALLGLAFLVGKRFMPTSRKGAAFAFAPILALAGWLVFLYQHLYWTCIYYLIT